MKNPNQECCPEFDVEKWDKKTFTWDQKLFIKESMPAFFHMPFPPMIGKKMKKMCALAERAEADIPDIKDALVLFHDPSAFRSEIYYSVTREVTGANNTNISGNFAARVFDGPYKAIPKYIKEMESYLADKGQKALDYYVHYAYCPDCSKKSGHNYMILFART
jgi:hypothetical protein